MATPFEQVFLWGEVEPDPPFPEALMNIIAYADLTAGSAIILATLILLTLVLASWETISFCICAGSNKFIASPIKTAMSLLGCYALESIRLLLSRDDALEILRERFTKWIMDSRPYHVTSAIVEWYFPFNRPIIASCRLFATWVCGLTMYISVLVPAARYLSGVVDGWSSDIHSFHCPSAMSRYYLEGRLFRRALYDGYYCLGEKTGLNLRENLIASDWQLLSRLLNDDSEIDHYHAIIVAASVISLVIMATVAYTIHPETTAFKRAMAVLLRQDPQSDGPRPLTQTESDLWDMINGYEGDLATKKAQLAKKNKLLAAKTAELHASKQRQEEGWALVEKLTARRNEAVDAQQRELSSNCRLRQQILKIGGQLKVAEGCLQGNRQELAKKRQQVIDEWKQLAEERQQLASKRQKPSEDQRLVEDRHRVLKAHRRLESVREQLADERQQLDEERQRLVDGQKQLIQERKKLTSPRQKTSGQQRLVKERQILDDMRQRLDAQCQKLTEERQQSAEEHRRLIDEHQNIAIQHQELLDRQHHLSNNNQELAVRCNELAIALGTALQERDAAMLQVDAAMDQVLGQEDQQLAVRCNELSASLEEVRQERDAALDSVMNQQHEIASINLSANMSRAEAEIYYTQSEENQARLHQSMSDLKSACDLAVEQERSATEEARNIACGLEMELKDCNNKVGITLRDAKRHYDQTLANQRTIKILEHRLARYKVFETGSTQEIPKRQIGNPGSMSTALAEKDVIVANQHAQINDLTRQLEQANQGTPRPAVPDESIQENFKKLRAALDKERRKRTEDKIRWSSKTRELEEANQKLRISMSNAESKSRRPGGRGRPTVP
ncbi:uncharacterized protein ASPGLDRAFT_33840 [Aspergillus glaucus CBS 516.65]|uniref:Integral membrane protein n=1 Tax=Aspergillus glaucus CBS 516.65 TaxID=1160497 RepID=A0A1L9VPS7_ASPGL|nr:hypothetical protein ASPGLDRAFT_33840 [Aspergillus glaucus CBS 516.65]OJJ85916.1 hypothetical protein ASPGLDRAFT_33840 [Aspergillus glaucus CBS 516.65]